MTHNILHKRTPIWNSGENSLGGQGKLMSEGSTYHGQWSQFPRKEAIGELQNRETAINMILGKESD
jgi:hypothetical protein